MKKIKLFKLLALFVVLITSIGTAWGQTFGATSQPNAQTIQSQQIMSGGAYNGTVYEPFSAATPSEANSPAQVGRRRGYDKDGNWTPDAPDMEYAGDTEQSELSPIGEPWVLAVFALAFAGMVALRRKRA